MTKSVDSIFFLYIFSFFFFQAEDGIRDSSVTGVQTCALPIFEGENGQRQRLIKAVLHQQAAEDSPHLLEAQRDLSALLFPRIGDNSDVRGMDFKPGSLILSPRRSLHKDSPETRVIQRIRDWRSS